MPLAMTTGSTHIFYQVDAFSDRPFAGNPAAVFILDRPADEAWMRNVAREMNLSETAFAQRIDSSTFNLRWLTPTVEVDLCGHATLATAHVLWETNLLPRNVEAKFQSRSGLLGAKWSDGWIELDFPSTAPTQLEPDFKVADLEHALGALAVAAGLARASASAAAAAARSLTRSSSRLALS